MRQQDGKSHGQEEPNLFSYLSYREYLQDYFLYKKSSNTSQFSYRNFSRMAGFKSLGYIHSVVKGYRNVGEDGVDKIIKYFEFDEQHSSYFKYLVQYDQTKRVDEKSYYLEKISRQYCSANSKPITEKESRYLSKWYLPVIREMVHMKGFKASPEWISKHIRPGIPVHEAEDALVFLIQNGFITKNSEGKWEQDFPRLETCEKTRSNLLKDFHKKMIELGYHSLNLPSDSRDVCAMTMSISKSKKELIEKKITQFNQEIQNIVLGDDGSGINDELVEIYGLNYQFFQLGSEEEATHEGV